MKRKRIDAIKVEVARLLQRIDELERIAGWYRYEGGMNRASLGAKHPEDVFNYGKYTAAVKRASLDLSKALVEIRR